MSAALILAAWVLLPTATLLAYERGATADRIPGRRTDERNER